jgi:hypothetical protein
MTGIGAQSPVLRVNDQAKARLFLSVVLPLCSSQILGDQDLNATLSA